MAGLMRKVETAEEKLVRLEDKVRELREENWLLLQRQGEMKSAAVEVLTLACLASPEAVLAVSRAPQGGDEPYDMFIEHISSAAMCASAAEHKYADADILDLDWFLLDAGRDNRAEAHFEWGEEYGDCRDTDRMLLKRSWAGPWVRSTSGRRWMEHSGDWVSMRVSLSDTDLFIYTDSVDVEAPDFSLVREEGMSPGGWEEACQRFVLGCQPGRA